MLGNCLRLAWREASHSPERISALPQCKYTDSTLTRMASTGARRASAQAWRSVGTVDKSARPLTRKVSSMPGTRKSKPTRPVCTMFSSVSRRLLPGASGISRVCASRAFTKPGSPPRGEASRSPAAPRLDITTKGDKPTKRCA